jgi:hypothetical protein
MAFGSYMYPLKQAARDLSQKPMTHLLQRLPRPQKNIGSHSDALVSQAMHNWHGTRRQATVLADDHANVLRWRNIIHEVENLQVLDIFPIAELLGL